MTQFQNRPCRPKMCEIPYIWRPFAALRLDLGAPEAISPATRRGIFSRRMFLCGFKGSLPDRAEIESITTEQKAGPDLFRGRDRTRRNQTMFAVIKTGGRQYRVVPDDVLEIGKIAGDVGSIVQLGEVR